MTIYQSAKTTKGNVGESTSCQELADMQASAMDLNGCTNCHNCTDCYNCHDCSSCTGCNNCTNCYKCETCTGCRKCVNCTCCSGCSNCRDCTICLCCVDCTSCINELAIDSLDNSEAVLTDQVPPSIPDQAFDDTWDRLIEENNNLRHHRDELREELAALKTAEQMVWRPMETAPKDGTVILVLLKGSDIPQSVRFRSGGWKIAWDNYAIYEYEGPTHWMPCPEKPRN